MIDRATGVRPAVTKLPSYAGGGSRAGMLMLSRSYMEQTDLVDPKAGGLLSSGNPSFVAACLSEFRTTFPAAGISPSGRYRATRLL
jgi:hypothetical protein